MDSLNTQIQTTVPQNPNGAEFAAQGMPPYQPAPVKQPRGWGKMFAAFGLVFVVLLIQGIVAVFGLLTESDEAMLAMGEIAGGIAALLFIIGLGGKHLVIPSLETFGEAWRIMKWIFLFDAFIAGIEIFSTVAQGPIEFAQLWGLRVLLLAILCFGIGLFEEATFRGLIFNGLLARMGTSKRGIFWAVMLSAIFFGLLHIDPTSVNFSDPVQILQAVFKVVQTGIFGFVAAVIVLRTQNLWPVIILHALNDFMLMFITYGVTANPLTVEYVSEGTDGLMVLAVYLLLCFAYSPSVVLAWRALKEHPAPDRGPFYRERSYPQPLGAMPATAVPVAGAMPPQPPQSQAPQ